MPFHCLHSSLLVWPLPILLVFAGALRGDEAKPPRPSRLKSWASSGW
jgi:hypothetical protein